MKKVVFLLISSILLLTSCEDKIDIKIDEGTSQLAVDAFISTRYSIEKRSIRLTKTSGYFNNSASPPALGATVKIKNNNTGLICDFIDVNSDGNYEGSGLINSGNFQVGDSVTLSIIFDGNEFAATSIINPAPEIDSVRATYKDANPAAGIPTAGYFVRFYANDIPGRTDFYWIKTFRNNLPDKNPSHINIAWDAAYGPGADGFTFILPIREAVTPLDKPFSLKDTISIEIHAINEDTWNFLSEVRTQTTNGGLFATPAANVRTNIKNANPNSNIKAVGWFVMSDVSNRGIIIY
jgi:hypothetical protein